MELNQCQITKEEINNVFENIKNRNNRLLEEIQQEKRDIDERVIAIDTKINRMMKFIQFRNKVDKIDACYHLMFPKKQINRVRKIHEKTEEVLLSKALKKTGGDELKAISLLFDPSSDIYI